MKIRRLPEIDLARVATLPTDQKRRALEHFKLGHPTITYKPVRSRFADIFNVQPDMFASVDPTAWPVLERLIRAKTTSDDECNANLLVAKGLHEFARSNALRSRTQAFFPLSLSIGEKVEYWLPMVTALNDAPLVVFIDPRRGKRLTAEARRFVFSMMHEHIRVANPDFAAARLGIVQFGDAADDRRPVKMSTDEGVELFGFDQLDQMVSERPTTSGAKSVKPASTRFAAGPLVGWTLEQLSGQVGVSRETIGKIERGVAAPLFETAEKIAVVLDVPVPVLFGADAFPGNGERARLLTEINGTLSRMNEEQLGRAAKMLKAFVG